MSSCAYPQYRHIGRCSSAVLEAGRGRFGTPSTGTEAAEGRVQSGGTSHDQQKRTAAREREDDIILGDF